MPQVIPVFTGLAAAISSSSLGVTLAGIGLKVGLTVYQQKRAKKAARRSSGQDLQQNFSQGALPRYAGFGLYRVGGQRLWFEAVDKKLYIGTILSDDVIDRVVSYYVRGIECLVYANSYVTTPPFATTSEKYVRFETKFGYLDQTASSLLQAAFPSTITANHVGAGIAYLVTELTQPSDQNGFQTAFNGQVPEIAALVAGWPVYDPRNVAQDEDDPLTWEHSTNPALLQLKYMTAPNGAAWSRSIFATSTFKKVADHCDELVALKSSALKKRYECGGTYSYDEEPADVIDKFQDTFSGRLYITEGGLFGLTCDGIEDPEIVITADKVLEISANRRTGALYEVTTIRSRFSSDQHGYIELAEEADPWVDETLADQIGREIPSQFDLPYVFRHDQARRLMKRKFYDLNPEWDIEATLDVEGLELFGENVCRFVYPLLGIDQTFRVISVALDQSSWLARVQVKLQSLAPEASQWDAATEEGTAPAPAPVTAESLAPQMPTNLSVVPGASRTVVFWDALTTGKAQEARYSPTGAGSWTSVSVSAADRGAELTGLTAGATYDFEVRVVDATYGVSNWASITFTNTAIVTGTGALSAFAANGGTANFFVSATQPASAAAVEIEFVSVASGAGVSWSGSTKVKTKPGGAATATISSPTGARDVYARSIAVNGTAGAVSGPIAVTVTAVVTGGGSAGSGNGGGGGNGSSASTGSGSYSNEHPLYGGSLNGGGSGGGSSSGGGLY